MGKKSGFIEEIPQLSSDPSSPSSGYTVVYPKTDGKLYYKTPAGLVVPLTSETDFNLYADANYYPESISFFDRITTISRNRRALNDGFIKRLWRDGLWQIIDTLYVLGGENTQASLLQLKSSSYNLTVNGGMTHEIDRGYTGNGTTGYLATGWTPSTNGVNFLQNSASMFLYCRTNVNEAKYDMGVQTGGITAALYLRDGTTLYYLLNDTDFASYTHSDSRGLWMVNRSGASAKQLYKNGVSVATSTGASSAPPTSAIDIGGINLSGTHDYKSTKQYALGGTGGSFTATQAASFYIHVQWYMTQIGANV